MELAEVYRVTYEGPDVWLRGIIASKDEENGYQYLFKDQAMKDDDDDDDINTTMLKFDTFEGYEEADKQLLSDGKPVIRSLDHIIPNAPMKSSIRAKDGFSIAFYLFGTVYETINFKYPPTRPKKLNAPRTKYILSRDGFRYLMVFYALFNNAVQARVKVTLGEKSVPFNLYGVIAARTSAITDPAYSSLIFCKRRGRGEKVETGKERGRVIPLSRDVVAVPLGHQLILQFGLYGCDNDERDRQALYSDEMLEQDNDKIVEKTLLFDAIEEGTSTDYIHCSKGTFQVVVSWWSTRKP